MEVRVTNRRLSARAPLPAEHATALEDVAARAGAQLTLVVDPKRLAAIGTVLGMGDRLRFMSPIMHSEMMHELRWTKDEALARRDGLDLPSLELTPTDEAAMRLISDWSVMAVVRDVKGGHGLATSAKKSVAGACAVGLLRWPTSSGSVPQRSYAGGAALQRVWLLATKLGLAFQPMTSLIYLFARLEYGGPGLDERERIELSELRARHYAIFPVSLPIGAIAGSRRAPLVERDPRSQGEQPLDLMVFRLAFAAAPSARSLRRPVRSMLRFE